MRTQLQKIASNSIGRRFTSSLILIVVIPMLAVFLLVGFFFSQQLFRKACQENLEVFKQTSFGLTAFVDDLEFVSTSILSDNAVQTLAKQYKNSDTGALAQSKYAVTPTIQSIMKSRPSIAAISIFDDSGICVQFGDLVASENQANLDAVKQRKGRCLWTAAERYDAPLLQRQENPYYVSLLRAVNDMHGMERLAIERISTPESSICELYSGFTDNGSLICIINEAHEIVSSTDKSMLGAVLDEQAISSNVGAADGYFTVNEWVYSYYKIPSVGWIVLKRDAKSTLWAGFRNVIFLLIVCMTLTVIFGVVFKRQQDQRIIKPLEALTQDVREFREGHFDIEMHAQNADEIAQLNQSFVDMGKYIKVLIEQEYKSKLCQKEIELDYMQSQINPHFLYNTLDSIRWMAVMGNQPEIAEQLEALSDLFRHTLNSGKKLTTVGEEITHVENYIKIQRNRFGDRIQFSIRADPAAKNMQVLNLVLQPLVENAIVHGLEDVRTGGHIWITVALRDGTIIYTVTDDGVGANQEKIRELLEQDTQSHHVFALKNIDQRIKYMYGNQYGLLFQSTIGEGTMVIVMMPAEGGTDGKTESSDC